MVRINIIDPKKLADQHLIAEYDEILMLFGYVKKYPEKKEIPESYRLGEGHIRFFKDKLLYLKKRHELIKKEMLKRGFHPTRTIDVSSFSKELCNDWSPTKKDEEIIIARLKEKLNKKDGWYRYCGKKKETDFFFELTQ